ncbi:Dihydroorotate dehydrogenase conserved site [Lasiodiplodia theobromae]|uniref:Dihydroorotate dehydrogenase (quinone), mitochondrial n=1 Tax=Lasiodiplodia theobromae TaxID=45133 RepID=A0A5N5DK42_9PEZI|nr:Dihydroorotate reductase [Lasiodiplodia theobromae]KAB2578279.1 Dihydroorotate dehydrogenase (quinone) [Lasiodiplodia theobromae]KAF4544880.1 Dihydroorotate reductase [Lasiodiplodia theobromae]KAF9637751.1 Dihydroorotate dehydrogenase conserved site [Lasiodiplodia theobromae]
MAARANVLSRHAPGRAPLRLFNQAPLTRQWQPSSLLRSPTVRLSSTTPEAASETASKAAAETAKEVKKGTRSAGSRFKRYAYGTTFALLSGVGYLYFTDTRASAHQYLVPPLIRTIWSDAEEAHHVGTKAMKTLYQLGLHPRERGDPDGAGDLRITVFGHSLDNPIGISAGLDKNADIPDPLFALGPAVVEVGGITPKPQPGNPQPRCFRVVSQEGLINRYGLNSEGADNIAARLRQRVREFAYQMGYGLGPDAEQAVLDGAAGVPPGSLVPGKLMCVQVAKNKTTPEADIEAIKNDYVYCVDRLAKYADVIVVNVSSPNTPGLRSLQRVEPLTRILTGVVNAAKAADRKTKPAVMVKVSPDEDTEEQMSGICDAVWESGVDGVIVGNTTKSRPAPLPRGYIMPAHEQETLLETGGYSGPQLFDKTLGMVAKYRKMLDQGPRLEPKGDKPETSIVEKIEAAAADVASEASASAEVKVADPTENVTTSPDDLTEIAPVVKAAAPSAAEKVAGDRTPYSHKPKEIWATGGVTNGKQALQLLNAGASVAMIYTTMVYNGSGTVTKIKNQMRKEIKKE